MLDYTRAPSIRQPHAALIPRGIKTVEYRGPPDADRRAVLHMCGEVGIEAARIDSRPKKAVFEEP